MITAFLSRILILVFGVLYPAYCSYKAVRTKDVKEYVKWMMYWIVYAIFTLTETLTDIFVSWFPFYYEAKIVFILYLLSPVTRGSSLIYRKFIHPILSQKEPEIDAYIASAKDKGYTTLLQLGSQGMRFASNTIVSSAVRYIPSSVSDLALNSLTEEGVTNIRRSQSNDQVDRGLDAPMNYSSEETETCARSRGPIKRKQIRKTSARTTKSRRNLKDINVDIDI